MKLLPFKKFQKVSSEIEQNEKNKNYLKMTSLNQTIKTSKNFEYLKFCQDNSIKVFGKKFLNDLKGLLIT